MFLYLLCVLFAYYILKPVSRAMFLNRFDIDKLPYLYILIAVFGGILAYFYSKLAAKTSLRTAVFWAMALSVVCLLIMWWLIRMKLPWMIYALNIWVSLFAIVLVSQGWLVASNLFNGAEAKRLYGLLGMGTVLGAAMGGVFTSRTAAVVGTENLLPASAVMVVLAYVAFRCALLGGAGTVGTAHAATEEEFSFVEVGRDLRRTRHLQVIIGIMVVTYVVDVLVEYQFQAMAKVSFHGDALTAFFGQFYGLYLNLAEIVFQLFLTSAVVRWFGVGGTLQILPTAVLISSVAVVAAPGVTSTAAVRLTEASTRYTLNRTGMELLYLPLPVELRNRVKAFIDVFVDRLSRGLGGVLLLALTATSLDLGVRELALIAMGLCIPWMLLSQHARWEYVATVRKRLEARLLDLESARLSVTDAETVRLLEATANGAKPRQAAYALSLLATAPGYDLRPLLMNLARSPEPEVREKVYDLAASLHFDGVLAAAMSEVEAVRTGQSGIQVRTAIPYVLAVSPDRERLAADFLNDENPAVVEGTIEALRADRSLAERLIGKEWLDSMASSEDPRRRALAAAAIGARGDQGIETLHRLFDDPQPEVAAAACRAAGALRNRVYLDPLVRALSSPRRRGEAIAALAGYGESICGSLADVLLDNNVLLTIRRQIPRVLKQIPHQRSVDVLLQVVGHQDLALRAAVLKGLSHLREVSPTLNFENTFVTEQILKEARHYYELNASLAPLHDKRNGPHTARGLLADSIEDRLRATLARLFRLLGLRYPPKEIYSAYLAVSRRHPEDGSAALDFLDSVLERDLKRVLLPLLDAPEYLLERGRELFGFEVRSAEQAIRQLIASGDPWLVACAMAAAGELKLRSLAPEIERTAAESGREVAEVARSVTAALA